MNDHEHPFKIQMITSMIRHKRPFNIYLNFSCLKSVNAIHDFNIHSIFSCYQSVHDIHALKNPSNISMSSVGINHELRCNIHSTFPCHISVHIMDALEPLFNISYITAKIRHSRPRTSIQHLNVNS